MRYLMLLSGTNPATPPPPALFEAIIKLGGEATAAGVLLDTAGLLPSQAGARVTLAGAMTIAAAVGVRRAMASRWVPRLIAIYGAGLIGAGICSADPANGFGPGAPLGKAAHISWHGAGHLIAASIGFAALIAACFVFARHFSRSGRRGLAWYSLLTGIVFGAAFAGVATGSASSAVVLPFYAAVLAAFAWLAVVSVHLYRRVA